MMLPRGSAKQNPVTVPAMTVEWAEARRFWVNGLQPLRTLRWSLAADFGECLNRTAELGAAGMPSRKIFRSQNCGAVAHALPVTGRVEDDPRLSRLYNRFYLQRDRSITNAERAADRKLARLQGRSAGATQMPSGSAGRRSNSDGRPDVRETAILLNRETRQWRAGGFFASTAGGDNLYNSGLFR